MIYREKLNYIPLLFQSGIGVSNYTVENIMASSNLNMKLKLEEVAEKLDDCEYNPDNFPGVIWRPKSSYGVVIITEDGRLMCTNVRSIDDVDKIFDLLIKKMEEKRLIKPRLTCPKCDAIIDAEDVVCIECGNLLKG